MVLLFVQAVFNALFAGLLLAELANAAEHGQTVLNAGLVRFGVGLSFVTAGAQLICAILILRRIPWSRPLAIGVEVITIGSGIIALVNNGASPQFFTGLGLPVLALVYLMNHEFTGWFTQDRR